METRETLSKSSLLQTTNLGLITDIDSVTPAFAQFPSIRFMGNKRKLVDFITTVTKDLKFDSVLDAFSGSGTVSYLFKVMGKEVYSNDYMKFCSQIAIAAVENNRTLLSADDIGSLLENNPKGGDFIQKTFNGLYFTPADNKFLDNTAANITQIKNKYKKAIAVSALCRAASKKQPRGVFTVTGKRYDDGRRDLKVSMKQQFIESVIAFNSAVFNNEKINKSFNFDVFRLPKIETDLVYLDPPYLTPHSDNDYIRRYHFMEGLASYWKEAKLIDGTKTKRIAKRPTPFSSRREIYNAFDALFSQFPGSTLLVSYSSNSIPTKEEMQELLAKHRRHTEVFEHNHRYSFGNHKEKVGSNRNLVREYLFLSY